MDALQAIDGHIGQVVEQRIAVIKLGGNESIGQENRRVEIQGRTNLTKQANLLEGGAAYIGDVVVEG